MSPLELYRQFFPHAEPSCYQQDLIDGSISDIDRWHDTLHFWAGNDYRPQSILKMIEYYEKAAPKIVSGSTQRDAIAQEQAMIAKMASELSQ